MPQAIEPWIAIFRQYRTQILVTCFALIVFFAGFHVPLPAQPQVLASYVRYSNPISVFALGLLPWVYSVVAAETLLLIFPALRLSARLANGHANPFGRRVLIFAIIISLVQGYGIANGLAALDQSSSSANYLLLLLNAVSMAAGMATIVALAQLIERSGIGMGFWVMIVAGNIFSFSKSAIEIPSMLSTGNITYREILIWGLASALAAAILVFLVLLQQDNGRNKIGALLWPFLFAGVLLTPLLSALQYVMPLEWQYSLLSDQRSFPTLSHALLVLFFASVFSRREKSSLPSWLELLALGLFLTLPVCSQSSLFRYFLLDGLSVALLAYASITIISQYKDSRRGVDLAKIFRTRSL